MQTIEIRTDLSIMFLAIQQLIAIEKENVYK